MRIYFLTSSGLFFVLQLSLVQCDTPIKSYSSFRPHPFCNPSHYMRYPTNWKDVVAIVNEAKSQNVTVKALGARHSISDIICTEGIPIDTSKLKSYKMNRDGITATFGAGVTLHEAGTFLLQHGRALRTTPAYGNITLGGAIGTGAHGSSIKYNSSLSAQVTRMTIVNGLGQKLVISDPQDLRSFKTHLGLLGVIVDVTLYTVALYKVLAHNYIVSDTILTNGTAISWAKTSDQIMFYWFPSLKEVVVANLTFVPVESPGTAFTNIVTPTYGFFNLILKKAKGIVSDLTSIKCAAASALANELLHVAEIISQSSLVYQTLGFVPYYTQDGILIKNPAVGYPHHMLASQCSEENAGLLGTACLWAHGDIDANFTGSDNEIGIPVTRLKDLVLTVRDIQTKTPVAFPLSGIVMRFSGKSDIYMSTAYQRDTVHVDFVVSKRANAYEDAPTGLAGYQTILQAMAKNMSGRSHWGKSGPVYHSSAMLDLKLDSRARKNFVAAMKKFDPNGIFLNNFGRRLLGSGTKVDDDPKTVHCALSDNCFCSKDSDCARTQNCISLPGYDRYPVCKSRYEVAESRFDRVKFSGVDLLRYLAVTAPVLVSKVMVECSLVNAVRNFVNVLGSFG